VVQERAAPFQNATRRVTRTPSAPTRTLACDDRIVMSVSPAAATAAPLPTIARFGPFNASQRLFA
jgi:hypothetical protein